MDPKSTKLCFPCSRICSPTSLQSEVVPLTSRISGSEYPCSPIKGLPPEVLVEIFLFATGGELVQDSSIYSISSVCRRWRSTCLGSTLIWSIIRIECPDSETDGVDCWDMDPLQLHLDRSKDHSLSISFRVGDDDESVFAEEVLDLLVQHCHRWVFAELDMYEELFKGKVSCAVKGKLPLLKHLDLNIFPLKCEGRAPTKIPDGAFSDCPALSIIVGRKCCVLALPWRQLTAIVEVPLVAFRSFTDSHIVLPNLTIWSILAPDPSEESTEAFLNRFETPALEHLTLINDSEDKNLIFPVDAVRGFISRIKKLQTLKLSCFIYPESEMITMLEYCPLLHSFIIWPTTRPGERYGKELFPALARSSPVPQNPATPEMMLIPKMTTLIAGGPISEDELATMVECRWKNNEGKIRLFRYSKDHQPLNPKMAKLVEDGLDVVFTVYGSRVEARKANARKVG